MLQQKLQKSIIHKIKCSIRNSDNPLFASSISTTKIFSATRCTCKVLHFWVVLETVSHKVTILY